MLAFGCKARGRRRIGRRNASRGIATPEHAVDEAWRARRRIPSEPKHGDLDFLAAELQRLVAAPHVQIEDPSLDSRTRIHHGVDAAVTSIASRDVDDAADREKRRIGGGDACSRNDTRTPSCVPLQYAVARRASGCRGVGGPLCASDCQKALRESNISASYTKRKPTTAITSTTIFRRIDCEIVTRMISEVRAKLPTLNFELT